MLKAILTDLPSMVDFVKKAIAETWMIDAATLKIIESNEHYKAKLGWDDEILMKVFKSDAQIGVRTREFVNLVKEFQKDNGLKEDGILGPATYDVVLSQSLSRADQAVKKIYDKVVAHESGGNYSAMNKDGEFKGLFDKTWVRRTGQPHPASGRTHIGLSFGSIQFTQDGGSLGVLLQQCANANVNKFKDIMGPTWDLLIQAATAKGPSGLSQGVLRGCRVQPVQVHVGGVLKDVDLWERPWTDRFEKLGQDPEFQAVQRRLALDQYLKPVLPFLKERKLTSEVSIACAFDGSVHRGVGGFRTLVRNANAKTEAEVLNYLRKTNDRFARLVNDRSLTRQRWEGWSNYE